MSDTNPYEIFYVSTQEDCAKIHDSAHHMLEAYLTAFRNVGEDPGPRLPCKS